jgi:hypothetical protein
MFIISKPKCKFINTNKALKLVKRRRLNKKVKIK